MGKADFQIDAGTGTAQFRDAESIPLSASARVVPSKYSDEADAVICLVQTYFEKRNGFCVDECTRYRELSDSCEAIEEGCCEDCPRLDSLLQEDERMMREEHEAVRDAMEQYP